MRRAPRRSDHDGEAHMAAQEHADETRMMSGKNREEDTRLDRYETAAVGATWLLARNVRILGETQWDFEQERARITLGVVSAF